jgi:tetratricopeptide (TPR) repeat protein
MGCWKPCAPTGLGLLAQAGEQEGAAAALAGWALPVAEDAAAGLVTGTGELAAARWLDAEDATMRQVLAWAMDHDTAMALQLAGALRWWWFLRGRLAGEYPLLREAAGRAEPGSDGWCAAQFCLGWTAAFSADLAGSLDHFTALRDAVADRPPCPALADALAGRSNALRELRRIPEAADDARRALALAQKIGYPVGELLALVGLSAAADFAGDYDDAVRLARQAAQVTAGILGSLARACSYLLTGVLTDAGDLAAAERVSAAGLARARDVGDLWNQGALLPRIVDLDLRAGRVEDATAHLREGLQIAVRTGTWQICSTAYTTAVPCAPRPGTAPRLSRCGPRATRWPGTRDSPIRPGSIPAERNGCARPGRCWDPTRRG